MGTRAEERPMPIPARMRPASMDDRLAAPALSAAPSSSGSVVSRNAFLRARGSAVWCFRRKRIAHQGEWN